MSKETELMSQFTWGQVNLLHDKAVAGTEFKLPKTYGGSQVYGKYINVGALPNSTSTTDAHGISGIGTVLELRGTAVSSGTTYPLPYAHTTSTSSIRLQSDATNITIVTTADYSGYTGIVYMEYTKTA